MKLIDNETKALLSVGLIRGVDLWFCGVFLAACLTLLQWSLIGHPTAAEMLVCITAAAVYFQLWIILLLVRLGVLVLQARADINLMPEAAARLAAGKLTGQLSSATAAPSMSRPGRPSVPPTK